MSLVHLLSLLMLLVIRNPIPLQAEHNMFERGAGTSFSSVSVEKGGNKHVQMQVCITIGCCQHVCRQFSGDSKMPSEQQQEPPELAPYAASPPQQAEEFQAVDLAEQWDSNGAVVPRVLEFSSQGLFSPAIKFLTIINTDNTSWIKILQATSTDEQFFVQDLRADSLIAPGESLSVAVVYLPRQTGSAIGRIHFQTTAGGLESQVTGEAIVNAYQVSGLEDIETAEGKLIQRTISFYNTGEDAVEIKELHVWPGSFHKKALCSSSQGESSTDKVSSCFPNGFQSASLSPTKSEIYASQELTISLEKLNDSWLIQPRKAADIARLEMTVSGADTWQGHVYMRFSRNEEDEVLILPLTLQVCLEDSTCKKETLVATPTVTNEKNAAAASGSWVQTNDLVAIRMAEALLKDLAYTLLRQREIKKGGLGANQKDATLISGQMLSFQTVQTGASEKVWINIVNPTQDPILVNLILASEAKSRNCKYMANWFWQGHKSQVHRDNKVFSFDAEATTEAVVQGGGKLALGPLTFRTRQKCDWTGLLFVKNSFTGLEWIPVRGKAASAALVFLDGGEPVQKLRLVHPGINGSMSKEEICGARFHRSFQMKNTGNMALEVRGIDPADAPDVVLGRTDGFSLSAGNTIDLVVSYKHDFQGTSPVKQVLKVLTSIGSIQIPVVATVPRELVSLCGRDPTFQEKIVLPVSVCALVLVMGIFSWLLLQEVSPQTDMTRQCQESIRKRTLEFIASIRTLRQVAAIKVGAKNVDSQECCVLKPVITRKQDEKLHLKKKRKPKNTSSPHSSSHSSSSSSGPGSPHSSSESELKIPAIERILNSSRFSEHGISPRKAKPRIDFPRKEQKLTDKDLKTHSEWDEKLAARIPPLESPDRSRPKREHEEVLAVWKGKLAVRIPSSDSPGSPANAKGPAKRSPESEVPPICQTPKPAIEENNVQPSPPSPRRLPDAASPWTPSTLAEQLENIWKEDTAAGYTSGGSTSSSSSKNNRKQLTSIGQLRKAAIERTTEKLQLREAQHQNESLYDIWGDHFGEISTSSISTPTSPGHFTPQSAQQSLFSQNLPSYREALDPFIAENSSGSEELVNSWNLLSFCPAVETYTGLPPSPSPSPSPPPPAPVFLEWNAESIYTTIVS